MEEGILMSKYRKKPVKVEAVQFDGTNESRHGWQGFTADCGHLLKKIWNPSDASVW